MKFSYSGNPATSELDKYRFLVKDTDANAPILSDDEVAYVLSTTTNHYKRLATLLEAICNEFAKEIKMSLGPQSQDPTERLKYYQKLASEYKQASKASGLSVPTYSEPNSFYKGMHDND